MDYLPSVFKQFYLSSSKSYNHRTKPLLAGCSPLKVEEIRDGRHEWIQSVELGLTELNDFLGTSSVPEKGTITVKEQGGETYRVDTRLRGRKGGDVREEFYKSSPGLSVYAAQVPLEGVWVEGERFMWVR